MTSEIKIGDKVPAFAAQSYDGVDVDNEDLLGSPYVLYFYAKDDTPGCTTQACSFRDNMEMFDDLNTAVIGISADNRESHVKFMQKHKLNFLLLSDEKLEVAKKFGAVQEETKKAIRSTFIVDTDGIVRWIEKPVTVEGHSERVLEALKNITKQEPA